MPTEVTDPAILAQLNGTSSPMMAPQPMGDPIVKRAPVKEPKTSYRTLSPAEAQANGLPAGGVYQVSSEGNISTVTAAPTAKEDKADDARTGNLDAVVQQINTIQSLYNQGIRDERLGNLFGALDMVNTPSNAAFDSAGAGLADMGTAAFKVPGMGPQSDADAARFVAANQPQASDWDTRIEQKLNNLRIRVDANRKAAGLPPIQWEGIDATATSDTPAAAIPPASGGQGGNTPPRIPGDGGGMVQAATGATRSEFDAGLSSQLDQLLRSGASFNELNQAAMQAGGQPISPREYAEARKFLRANPNYDKLIVNVQRYQPQSTFEQVASAVGSNPVGNYMMNAGQMLSGNTLDNMASDPTRARMSMDISNAQNPTASTLGQLTGGAMAGLAGEAGLARLGIASGLGRGVAADAVAGAANGAGMADGGDRLSGAATGGVSGGLGSLGGSLAVRGVARAVAPSGGNLADLYASGVRPTVGQRFANVNDGKGLSGMMGRAVNASEEALQSVPIVGSAIRGARQEARDQFQVGAFNESLKEIGETLPKGMGPGTDPHKYAQAAFNRVYDEARSGMRLVADEELANDLGGLAPDISALGPQAQNKLKAIMANSVNNKVAGGAMDGGAYKKAMADLGKHIARHRKSAMADDQGLADVLESVRDSLDAAARRHSDPEAVQLLDAADAGYAKLVRIEEASARRGGDAGTFSPAQFDSAVQKTSGGVRSKAYLRGDAAMQDYAAQGRSLEDRVPNSGTPERMAVGGTVAGGAAYIEPTTLGVLGAIAGAYAPGARKVMQKAMAPGGPKAKAIAERLRKRARLVGAAGAASAVSALPGTSPAQ